MSRTFTDDEFHDFVFKSKEPLVINEEVKKYINKKCIVKGSNYTPCEWAARYGHLEVIKYLMKNGTDIITGINLPVRWAATHGHFEVVKYLVENGANITIAANVTISILASNGDLEMVKYLLNTFIYSEEYIHDIATSPYFGILNPEIKELLLNYRQFSRTKACKY